MAGDPALHHNAPSPTTVPAVTSTGWFTFDRNADIVTEIVGHLKLQPATDGLTVKDVPVRCVIQIAAPDRLPDDLAADDASLPTPDPKAGATPLALLVPSTHHDPLRWKYRHVGCALLNGTPPSLHRVVI